MIGRKDSNLLLLGMFFAVTLVIANVVASKVVQTGIPLFGATITIPGAVLCYAITFLITDIVGEIWGKAEANRIVRFGFIVQIFASIMILLTQYLPAVDGIVQDAYVTILGQNFMFALGSLTAYIISQSWDVFIFHKFKDHDGSTRRWVRNNVSTMTSQIIDTVIFIGIAFGIGFGWLFDPSMLPTLGAMMVGQYFVKFLIAACDTPIFYLMTNKRNA